MKAKITIVLIVNFLYLGLSAQIPFVYTKENTGANFPSPTLLTIDRLPVVDPLPDPFLWSDGSGRLTKFSDWEKRRNEIRAEIEYYEIGKKPERPEAITASYDTGMLTVSVTVNEQTLTLTAQVALPTGSGPFPAVIGMNSLNGSLPADIFTMRSSKAPANNAILPA